MKGLTVIIAAFILVFGSVASRAANLDRISSATGVPVATLQTERASTGLGWGSLEKAHLLANATGQVLTILLRCTKAAKAGVKLRTTTGSSSGRS